MSPKGPDGEVVNVEIEPSVELDDFGHSCGSSRKQIENKTEVYPNFTVRSSSRSQLDMPTGSCSSQTESSSRHVTRWQGLTGKVLMARVSCYGQPNQNGDQGSSTDESGRFSPVKTWLPTVYVPVKATRLPPVTGDVLMQSSEEQTSVESPVN